MHARAQLTSGGPGRGVRTPSKFWSTSSNCGHNFYWPTPNCEQCELVLMHAGPKPWGGWGAVSPPPKNIKKIMSWQNRVELITLTLGFSNLVTFLQLGKTWIFQLEFSNLHFPTWIFQLAFSNLHFPTWIFQLNFPTWIFQLEFSN